MRPNYNPRKINVHEATWEFGNENVHLFVELRDLNFPGSKYNLLYAQGRDVLEGTSFLAVHKQTFHVSFMRKN